MRRDQGSHRHDARSESRQRCTGLGVARVSPGPQDILVAVLDVSGARSGREIEGHEEDLASRKLRILPRPMRLKPWQGGPPTRTDTWHRAP